MLRQSRHQNIPPELHWSPPLQHDGSRPPDPELAAPRHSPSLLRPCTTPVLTCMQGTVHMLTVCPSPVRTSAPSMSAGLRIPHSLPDLRAMKDLQGLKQTLNGPFTDKFYQHDYTHRNPQGSALSVCIDVPKHPGPGIPINPLDRAASPLHTVKLTAPLLLLDVQASTNRYFPHFLFGSKVIPKKQSLTCF
nr:uncharacterized protein LOC105467400 isoform X2 [Macaca nemestrina]